MTMGVTNQHTTNLKDQQQSAGTLADLLAEITPQEQERTAKKMRFAARLMDAIEEKGWNKTTFAAKMGVQKSVISRWLSGTHNFSWNTLVAIEEVLGMLIIDDGKQLPVEVNIL